MIKMNIALTGASGSIGKELLPFLKSLGHRVFIISSSTPSDGEIFFSYEDLKNKTFDFPIDIFFHLASINSNLDQKDINNEVQLTKEVLSSLPSLSCKRLIFFSSSKVYGDNSFSSTTYNELFTLKPICAYGMAKKLCEEVIKLESSKINVRSIIFRLPPVLNQSTDSNLGKLIKFSKSGIPIPMLAQGITNQRSFLSFNNLETIIHLVLSNKDSFAQNKIYNLADRGSISLNELLKIAGKGYLPFISKTFSNFLIKIPFLKKFLLRLYGNFVLDNSKLQDDMDVKLKTTQESLPIIYS